MDLSDSESRVTDQDSRPYKHGYYFDEKFKVVIVGCMGVGKTSIIRSWCGNPFLQSLTFTIGFDVFDRLYDFPSGILRLSVWDTAGQERFHSICASQFREAKAFIFVYDVTKKSTFKILQEYWLKKVDDEIDDEAVPVFVVGNKTDLPEPREVSTEEGQQFADSQGAYGIFETSAKTGDGVSQVFRRLAETMVSTWGLRRRCKLEGDEAICCVDQCQNCGRTHPRKSIQVTDLGLGKNKKATKCCSG